MIAPETFFVALVWCALVGVAAAAIFLLVILVHEWRNGTLW
jgi:hypothetical protein